MIQLLKAIKSIIKAYFVNIIYVEQTRQYNRQCFIDCEPILTSACSHLSGDMGKNKRFSEWINDKGKTMKKNFWLNKTKTISKLETEVSDSKDLSNENQFEHGKPISKIPEEVEYINESYKSDVPKTIAVAEGIPSSSGMVPIFEKLKEKSDSSDVNDDDTSSSGKTVESSVSQVFKSTIDSMELVGFSSEESIVGETSSSLPTVHSIFLKREVDNQIQHSWRHTIHEDMKHPSHNIETVDDIYVIVGTDNKMGQAPPVKPKRLFLSDFNLSVEPTSSVDATRYEENRHIKKLPTDQSIFQEYSKNKVDPPTENITPGKVHQLVKKFDVRQNSSLPDLSLASGSNETQEQALRKISEKIEQLMKLFQVRSEDSDKQKSVHSEVELKETTLTKSEEQLELDKSVMQNLIVVDNSRTYMMQNRKVLPSKVLTELIEHIERANEEDEEQKKKPNLQEKIFAPAKTKRGKCLIQ